MSFCQAILDLKKLSDYVQTYSTDCNFPASASDSWVILSPIEQSIKRKIEAVGTPLKDWDIQINYGIKTGFNDAFILGTEKRAEILANCKTEDERHRTDELIRPVLRGKDIKRYGYEWAGLWIINTHNGIKGKLTRIDVNEYPAIKAHLDQYWDMISNRSDKGDTPYNLRNCAYMEDFYKPKIIWGEISDRSKFAFDSEGIYVPEATTFLMIGKHLSYLFCVLNSPLSEWFFSTVGTTTGVGTVRWKKYTIQELIIPNVSPQQETFFLQKVQEYIDKKIDLASLTYSVNKQLYFVIGLSDEEVSYIENYYPSLL